MILRLKTEEEWLAKRKQVVTATEAPVLLGLNKYKSPNKMMQEKELNTFEGNAYTWLGQILEPVVLAATNEVLKTDFQLLEDITGKLFYEHKDIALGATPDAFRTIPGEIEFLECKTTKPLNYLKYSKNPPEYYIMQLMTQLYCAGLKVGYLSIMSTDLTQNSEELALPISVFKVEYNRKLCNLLKDEVNRFWECKKTKKMFRIDSKVKIQARLLVHLSYQKIY